MRKLRLFLGICLALGTLAPRTVSAQSASLSGDIILLSKETQTQQQYRLNQDLGEEIGGPKSILGTSPKCFVQQVSTESPAVELPRPVFMPQPDALIEDVDADISAKVPENANDGCVIVSPSDSGLQGSSQPSRGCCWIPRGPIPYLRPRDPGVQRNFGGGEPLLAPNWQQPALLDCHVRRCDGRRGIDSWSCQPTAQFLWRA